MEPAELDHFARRIRDAIAVARQLDADFCEARYKLLLTIAEVERQNQVPVCAPGETEAMPVNAQSQTVSR